MGQKANIWNSKAIISDIENNLVMHRGNIQNIYEIAFEIRWYAMFKGEKEREWQGKRWEDGGVSARDKHCGSRWMTCVQAGLPRCTAMQHKSQTEIAF